MTATDMRRALPRPRLRRSTRLESVVVYGALTALAASYGYWLIFSVFASYDDEGFFDFTLRLFIQGHPLYNVVWTTYGPFYYEVFGALFKLLGQGPTTDSGRLVQLTLWVLSSLALGLVAQRVTRRLSIGAATFAAAFYLMRALVNEPMHAEALVCFLLASLVVVIVFAMPLWRRCSLAAVGAITSALLLSKINVGGYAAVSIAFAAAMTGQSIVRRRRLSSLAALAFVGLAPALMASDLNRGTTQTYALVVVASTLAIAFVAMPERTDAEPSDDSWSWIGWMLVGAVGLSAGVLAVLLALGSSLGAFVHMVIVEPTSQASFLSIPAQFDSNAVAWSLAADALAWACRCAGWLTLPPQGDRARLTSGIVRLFVGFAIVLSLADFFPFQIAPDAPFSLAMPLAFAAAIPPFGASSIEPWRRFTRVLVPSLAVLQCLLAYPVAGSQLELGGILLFACGAVCVADGATELELWKPIARARKTSVRSALGGLFLAVAVGSVYLLLVNQQETSHNTYRAQYALAIPGATRLRLPSATTAQFDQMYQVLRAQCSTLISLPALYSFNNWTGLPWPNSIGGAQPYWKELSSKQQEQTLEAARRSPRLCIIRNPTLAAVYGAVGQTPLITFLDSPHFRTIFDSPPYSIVVSHS